MWDRKADFIPFKPPFIRCFGIELRYADRKREQDFGVYQYHHHAALREGDKQETRKRHIRFREHRREMSDKEAEHQKEVSFLKAIILKAKKWFLLFQELVYMERFYLNGSRSSSTSCSHPLGERLHNHEALNYEHQAEGKFKIAGFPSA